MSNIDKVRIHNFKAFYTGSEPDEIDLGGKHLLMYGENGSGKSSIYWALYTLFQSETKSTDDIAKYFTPTHDEQLLNYNYLNQRPDFVVSAEGKITNPTDIGKNAEIEVLLKDNSSLKIDKDGNHESVANKIRDLHRHSDFITHRLLVNFYNFRNSKEINLWEVFVRDFFPTLISNKNKGNTTLAQELQEIETNLPFNLDETSGTLKRSRSKQWQKELKTKIDKFNADIEYWIGRINTIANDVYKKELKIKDEIEIFLDYSVQLRYDHYKDNEYEKNGKTYTRWTTFAGLNEPVLKLNVKRINADGTFSLIHRPQAYLNEAKITQIALSIRFSLLHKTIKPDYPGQFLALDDLLISLDMSNRDIVLDAILNIYAKRFKIYFFTHEKSYYDFCVFKIEQKKEKKDWKIMEIHSGATNIDKPIIIQSGLNYYGKAIKYFQAKDFTTSSLYLRKELEKLIINRIPDEFSKTIDGQYHNLEHYWKLFVERYEKLNLPISEAIKLNFKQSKLMILNPEAHHNLELPVYKLELERAFDLVRDLYDNYPIPVMKILFSKGMTMQFVHPTENYTFDFELLTDFSVNNLDATSFVSIPRCKVIKWQFNDVEFWDFPQSKPIEYNLENPIVQKLNQIIDRHINHIPLQISKEIFIDNLNINNSIWSFKEIINKVGITV